MTLMLPLQAIEIHSPGPELLDLFERGGKSGRKPGANPRRHAIGEDSDEDVVCNSSAVLPRRQQPVRQARANVKSEALALDISSEETSSSAADDSDEERTCLSSKEFQPPPQKCATQLICHAGTDVPS